MISSPPSPATIWCHSCSKYCTTPEPNQCPECQGVFVEVSGQNVESFINSPQQQQQQLSHLRNIVASGRPVLVIRQAQSSSRGQERLSRRRFWERNAFIPNLYDESLRDNFASDDALDNILHRILMSGVSNPGVPPASDDSIAQLSRVTVDTDSNFLEGNQCCGISHEQFEIGDIVIKLICGHTYKEDSIIPWLRMHNTCPVCRLTLS